MKKIAPYIIADLFTKAVFLSLFALSEIYIGRVDIMPDLFKWYNIILIVIIAPFLDAFIFRYLILNAIMAYIKPKHFMVVNILLSFSIGIIVPVMAVDNFIQGLILSMGYGVANYIYNQIYFYEQSYIKSVIAQGIGNFVIVGITLVGAIL